MKRSILQLGLVFTYLFVRISNKLSELLTPIEFFLPAVLLLVETPAVAIFSVPIGLDLTLLIILFATTISHSNPEINFWELCYTLLLGFTGILAWFVVGFSFGFVTYLVFITVLAAVSILLLCLRYELEESIERTVQYIGLTVLLGLTAGLIQEMRWIPEISLAIIGGYAIYLRITRRFNRISRLHGVDEVLLKSIDRLGKSPKGIATGGLVFAGIFAHLSSITLLLPFLLTISLTHETFSDLTGIVLNGSAIMQLLLFLVILMQWLSLLSRTGDSLAYWGSESYDYDLERDASNRPLIRGLVLPVLGVVLAEIPQGDVETYGPISVAFWDSETMLVYLFILLAVFVYSVASVPYLRVIRKFVPAGKLLVSSRPSLRNDFRTYLTSGLLLAVFYTVTVDSVVIWMILGLLCLYVLEVFFKVDESRTLIFTTSVFVIAIPMVALPPDVASNTVGQLWHILTTFLFVYALSVVNKHSKTITKYFRSP